MNRRRLILLLSLLMTTGHLPADLVFDGGTDQFSFPVFQRFKNTKRVIKRGRFPEGWDGANPGYRSIGEVRVDQDPLTRRTSFMILNLAGPTDQELVTTGINTVAGTSYNLQYDLMTFGNAYGVLESNGTSDYAVPLQRSKNKWTTQTQRITAGPEPLVLKFRNRGMGQPNAMYISRISLKPIDRSASVWKFRLRAGRPGARPVLPEPTHDTTPLPPEPVSTEESELTIHITDTLGHPLHDVPVQARPLRVSETAPPRDIRKTDGSGSVQFPGFPGEYEILVSRPDGRELTTRHMLSAGGSTLNVRLPQ